MMHSFMHVKRPLIREVKILWKNNLLFYTGLSLRKVTKIVGNVKHNLSPDIKFSKIDICFYIS